MSNASFLYLLIIPWKARECKLSFLAGKECSFCAKQLSLGQHHSANVPFQKKFMVLICSKSVVCLWKKPHQIQKNKQDLKLFQAAANSCSGNSSLITTEVLHKALMFIAKSPHHPIKMLSYLRCNPHIWRQIQISHWNHLQQFYATPFQASSMQLMTQPPLQLHTRCACKQHFLHAAPEWKPTVSKHSSGGHGVWQRNWLTLRLDGGRKGSSCKDPYTKTYWTLCKRPGCTLRSCAEQEMRRGSPWTHRPGEHGSWEGQMKQLAGQKLHGVRGGPMIDDCSWPISAPGGALQVSVWLTGGSNKHSQ